MASSEICGLLNLRETQGHALEMVVPQPTGYLRFRSAADAPGLRVPRLRQSAQPNIIFGLRHCLNYTRLFVPGGSCLVLEA